MATRTNARPVVSPNWTISSPGRLPNRVVVFDLPEGATIDLSAIVVSSSIPSLLTGVNPELNTAIYTDGNGVDHAIGTVLIFDVEAAADIEPKNQLATGWNPDEAHRLYIRYATDDAPDEQQLDYEKIVEVYRRLPF